MLFQRLYNWIKYKTLPPSILFKNRLFIERDNKHKRILSNFGLSFRNSKWSNYSTYNVKTVFQKNFVLFFYCFIFIVLLLLFCFNFKKYYLFFYFYNLISFYFWTSLDSFDYYVSYFFWASAGFFSFFFNSLYCFFFFNNFSKLNNESSLKKKVVPTNSDFFLLSRADTNWFLYSFLTSFRADQKNNASHGLLENSVIEKLFSVSTNYNAWANFFDLYIKLFRTTFFFNLLKKKNNLYFFSSTLKNVEYLGHQKFNYLYSFFLFNSKSLNNFSPHFLFFALSSNLSFFDSINLKNQNNILNFKNAWNLINIEKENVKNNFLIKNKLGFFFLFDLTNNKLTDLINSSREFSNLNTYLLEQSRTAKTNRWLYRYSTLHRKILKNSHKITLTKKVLNFNFYSKSIFNKNLWNSEYLFKGLNSYSSSLNSFLKINFLSAEIFNALNDFNSQNVNLNSYSNQFTSLHSLKFYEMSYFWYLKRIYFFNSLKNNSVKARKKNNLSPVGLNNPFQTVFNRQLLNASFFLKSYRATSNFFFTLPFQNLSTRANTNKFLLNDLFLVLGENEFYNKDSLTSLFYITNNINYSSGSYNFFSFLKNKKNSNRVKKFTFLLDAPFDNHYRFQYFLASSDIDLFFFKDLNYFFLFK